MVGANSIYCNYRVKNIKAGKTIEVIIQANKNFGVCDVIFPIEKVAPQKPVNVTKESNKAYKEAKYEYDCYIQHIKNMRQAVLNKYQGQQLVNVATQDEIGNFLFNLLNAE